MSARFIDLLGFKTAILAFLFVLAGCSDTDDAVSNITVNGTVFASNVSGASVTVSDANGNVIADAVTTDGQGHFTIAIPENALTQALIFESNGGSFVDEATGQTVQNAGMLATYIAANGLSDGATVNATPGSTIVHYLVMQHGMTANEAENAFNNAFGYTPDSTITPTDATNPENGATDEQLLNGLHAAAFSQLANNLGLTASQQFALFEALAQDLSDDTLDGEDATGDVTIDGTSTVLPGDIHNHYSMALTQFHGGNNDNTGLTNAEIGGLPFATIAQSETYQVEYIPGMMAAMQGQTTFTLRITENASGDPVSGVDVSLMPMMYMAMHQHGTPVGDIVDNNDGTYTCTIYYLMASSMMGTSMGYWELQVMIGGMMGESVSFYPDVMMAMSDTVRATLKGQSDLIEAMAMGDMGGIATTENRSYYLFNNGLTGITDNHDLELFIAAKESMMSYPAVYDGQVLNAGDANYELTISSIEVDVSTDASTWVSANANANDGGNGLWTASGLTGLTDGTEGNIYVRLTVNGEQKTTDGTTPNGDSTNDYATFTVTPGSGMAM